VPVLTIRKSGVRILVENECRGRANVIGVGYASSPVNPHRTPPPCSAAVSRTGILTAYFAPTHARSSHVDAPTFLIRWSTIGFQGTSIYGFDVPSSTLSVRMGAGRPDGVAARDGLAFSDLVV